MLVDMQHANLLVTGGAGFMGSAFIRHLLLNKNFQGNLVNLDLLTYAANLSNLKEIEDDSRYHFVRGDIADANLLRELQQQYHFNAIVHFAAETHVDRSIKTPQSFVETNVLGTFQLLELVRENPEIHFHHISTDEVYGSLKEEGAFTETSNYHPNSPYSASKAASDHFVKAYSATYTLSVTLSHAGNNYGPYQFPEKFIPLMILNCLETKPLPIYGDGQNVRDWLYVEDHAEAVYKILSNGKKGETYNIGSKNEWNNLELLHRLIDEVADMTSKDPEEYYNLITYVPDRLGHDFRYALNTDKITDTIGWTPETDFIMGIRKTIKWYLDNPEWIENIKSGDYHAWIDEQYGAITC